MRKATRAARSENQLRLCKGREVRMCDMRRIVIAGYCQAHLIWAFTSLLTVIGAKMQYMYNRLRSRLPCYSAPSCMDSSTQIIATPTCSTETPALLVYRQHYLLRVLPAFTSAVVKVSSTERSDSRHDWTGSENMLLKTIKRPQEDVKTIALWRRRASPDGWKSESRASIGEHEWKILEAITRVHYVSAL